MSVNMSHMMQRLLMVHLGSEKNRCLDVVKSFGSCSDEVCNMLIAQDCVSKANSFFQNY